ncbi:hypothetical protein N7450_007298 [Penicillium hetheringtonii]|uniref:Uncharacterized protein n=1 Tax=Penicillium hetheringtonii TaxID=911720 RepID=A0AAD6DHB4_9EURO|nr:hypothetical protein N7450_007298 [Penicillium hetheringtonii]
MIVLGEIEQLGEFRFTPVIWNIFVQAAKGFSWQSARNDPKDQDNYKVVVSSRKSRPVGSWLGISQNVVEDENHLGKAPNQIILATHRTLVIKLGRTHIVAPR